MTKKITVVGANGKTGQQFIKLALKKGYQITAIIHKHNNLNPKPNLKIVSCDTTNANQLDKLLPNDTDVVLSFIGHVRGSSNNVQTKTTENLLKIMQAKHIKRLISLTGTGVRFEHDKITFIDRLLNTSIGLIDPSRIKDGIEHVSLIKQSELDWTIIRVLKLTNSNSIQYQLKLHGPAKTLVSRQSVALASLELIEKNNFIKQAPIIGR